MALSQNLYRRGALYWWRRRFVDPVAGRSRMVALGLGVHEPAAARRMGAALNERAYQMASRGGPQMGTIEDIRGELKAAVEDMRWHVGDGVYASLARSPDEVATDSEVDLTLTPEQERAVLLGMAREAEAGFVRTAQQNRMQVGVDDHGRPRDPIQEAIDSEKAFAVIYRAIAEGGRAARLTQQDRAALGTRFSEDTIGFMTREVAYNAQHETATDWLLGPPRSYFVGKLEAAGLSPSLLNIRSLRRSYLLLCASMLDNNEWRYAPSPNAGILADLERERLAGIVVPAVVAQAVRLEVALESPTKADIAIAPATQATKHLADGVQRDFMTRVETLIRQETKAGKWDDKTAKQHRSVARLFVKATGSDDPSTMTQDHIGAFRSLLDELPKNWGKSPADAARTIDEIKARAQDLDDDEVGLAPGTIDRQLTQISNILSHLADNGIIVGQVTKKMRTGGKAIPRGVFSLSELNILTRSDIFTGDPRTRAALFWVIVLGIYQLCRLNELCGLMVADIDFEGRAFMIQNNLERKLKTVESHRRMPVVPELIRLGFFEYAASMRDAGHTLLFPCLRERGQRTPLSNLFYKDFFKLLAELLPSASEQRKSFHSLRKAGNTYMVNGNINDPIRHAVMGHAHSGANEAHYLDQVWDGTKLAALSHIPNVTAHLG